MTPVTPVTSRRPARIGEQCGHHGCPRTYCWWYAYEPHSATNPDPRSEQCRYCLGRHLERRVDGWTTCADCGTARWTMEATT